MPCKLCEMDPQQQKLSSSSSTSCNHILDYASSPPYVPFSSLEQLAIQSNNGLLLPQMRDMMLAAYLLRGKKIRQERRNSKKDSCVK